jgi:hypothetical protein
MFERPGEMLLPRTVFLSRTLRNYSIGAAVVGVWLLIGVIGYHWLGRLPWIDALLNASMIISGMGPVDPLPSPTAKVFASFYAVLSGVVFLSTTAILVAPVVHRVMNHFHRRHDQAGDKNNPARP